MPISPKYFLSGKDKSQKSSRPFTDREIYIEAFLKLLESKTNKKYNVLVYYGVGGIGKTSLRKELARILDTKFEKNLWAGIDFEVPTYREQETALFVLRNMLNDKYGINFPSFDLAYTTYWQKTHPQTSLTKENFPLLTGANVVAGIVRVVGEMPWVGWLPKITKAIMTGANVYREWWKKRGERELADLPELEAKEIAMRLPMFWASDLKDYVEEKKVPVVFFLDTYEALWEYKSSEGGFLKRDEWIRELVSNLPEILWVICGREKLRWDEIDSDWNDFLYLYLVGEMVENDSRKFLQACKVTEESVQNIIIQTSRGLPYFLELAVDTYNEIKNRYERDPIEDDFAKSQREVLERFLRYLDRTEIATLKVLSCLRFWNFDIFEKLVHRFKTGYPVTEMLDLCRFSFITESNIESSWQMHTMMRESIQFKLDTDILKYVHQFMFKYYDNMLKDIDIKNITEEQKIAFTEAFYHCSFALSPTEHFKWFNNIYSIFEDAAEWRFLINLNHYMIVILENNFKEDDIMFSNLYDNLGVALNELGKYSEAEENHLHSLKIKESNSDINKFEILITLNNLALLYFNEGRYHDAEPICLKALEICKNGNEKDCPNISQTYNTMALLYMNKGLYQDAKKYFENALEIDEGMLGSGHPNIAGYLNNLASVYSFEGKIDKAIELIKRSLEINEKTHGKFHPDIAENLNNLAVLYDNIGNYVEAEMMYKKAIEIKKELFGENHPGLSILYNNFASLYITQKKFDEAESWFEKAISVIKNEVGDEHPNLARYYIGLAYIYINKKDFTKAEELLISSLGMIEKFLGENHPDIAIPLKHLGSIYEIKNDKLKAIDFYVKAFNIRKNYLGEEHIKTIELAFTLGKLYSDLDEFEKSEFYFNLCQKKYENSENNNKQKLIKIFEELLLLYKKCDKEDKENEIREKLFRLYPQ